MPHEAQTDQSSTNGSPSHRILPAAGITAAGVAVLAHFAGGAAVMHLGLGAVLAAVGVNVTHLGSGVLVVGLVVAIAIKLLLIVGAHWWRQHR